MILVFSLLGGNYMNIETNKTYVLRQSGTNNYEIVHTVTQIDDIIYVKNLSKKKIERYDKHSFIKKVVTIDDVNKQVDNSNNFTKFNAGEEVYIKDFSNTELESNHPIFNYYKKAKFIYYDAQYQRIALETFNDTTHTIDYCFISSNEKIFNKEDLKKDIETNIQFLEDCSRKIMQEYSFFKENNWRDVPVFDVEKRIANLEEEKKSILKFTICKLAIEKKSDADKKQIAMIDKGIKRLNKMINRFNKRYPKKDINATYQLFQNKDTIIANINRKTNEFKKLYKTITTE